MARKPPSLNECPQDIGLINFVVRKSETVAAPFSLRQLCREYMNKTNSSKPEKVLIQDIAKFRHIVHLVAGIHLDLRAKIIFALSAPVDGVFLNELRKYAYVEVDEFNRIITYEKIGGGLKLVGKHSKMSHSRVSNVDMKILHFLAKKARNSTSIISNTQFAVEYIDVNGVSVNLVDCRQRYAGIKKLIYSCTEFDEPTRIRMLFVSKTRLIPNVLEKLRENAIVEVNNDQQIIQYRAYDGSLDLSRDGAIKADHVPMFRRFMSSRRRRSHHPDLKSRLQNSRRGLGENSGVPEHSPSPTSNTSPQYLVDNNSNDSEQYHFTGKNPIPPSRITKISTPHNRSRGSNSSVESPRFVPLHTLLSQLSCKENNHSSTSSNSPSDKAIEFQNRSRNAFRMIECTEGVKFLKILRGLVHDMDKILLVELEKDIDKNIRKLNGRDYQVSYEEILKAFDIGLTVMFRCAKTEQLSEESTSLKEFIQTLQTTFYKFTSVKFEKYRLRMEEVVHSLGNQDKCIAIKHIRPTLETVFLLALEEN